MNADDYKKLEDRVTGYVAAVPDLIASMLYRQLHRARDLHMSGIDGSISRLREKTELRSGCGCAGRHKTDVAFSHWIAGDES